VRPGLARGCASAASERGVDKPTGQGSKECAAVYR